MRRTQGYYLTIMVYYSENYSFKSDKGRDAQDSIRESSSRNFQLSYPCETADRASVPGEEYLTILPARKLLWAWAPGVFYWGSIS